MYLGAFFVIIAAAILAALVEAARLPVLLITTTAFAAGAVVLKRRLPQPSFALAIVFSFLLPIDANVIADTLSLSARSNEVYWSVIFLLMAVIWGLGTWFYASRLFSVVAFLSLSLAALRFGEIFDASTDWNVFSVSISALLGLIGVRLIKAWKDRKFALPLFLLAQFFQFILLFVSLFSIFENKWIGSPPGDWIAPALTWLLAASFYAASDILVPFVFFPWTAAASLFLVPWLVLSAFDASTPVQHRGVRGLGRAGRVRKRIYPPHWPRHLDKISLPACWSCPCRCFSSPSSGDCSKKCNYGFAAFLVAGIAYTVVNTLRRAGTCG